MARVNSHISKQRQNGIMTRLRCVELRLTGMTYEAIGDHLNMSSSSVYSHCKKAFTKYHEQTMETVEMIVAEELQRCDRMLLGLWPNAARGDVKSVGAVLRIMERKAAMLGLDKLANRDPMAGDGTASVTLVTIEEPQDVEAWAAKYKDSVSVNQEGGEV